MSICRWACGGRRAYVCRERRRACDSCERRLISREQQTRMSCGRRRRSSANGSRFTVNAGLGELHTVMTSIFVRSISLTISSHRCISEHVSGAERGASEERSVQNIVGAWSGFLSKGWSDRSVSLRFRSDTTHTTSLGHAQIHPEFTCAFNN